MKSYSFAILSLFFVCFFPFLSVVSADYGYGDAAGEGVESATGNIQEDVRNTMDNARSAYDEAAEMRFRDSIPSPEEIRDQASSCFDGIMNADGGFGLNVPSISSLLGSACQNLNQSIRREFTQASQRFTAQAFDDLVGVNVGVGAGYARSPETGIAYDQKGREIADEMWQEIESERRPWKRK